MHDPSACGHELQIAGLDGAGVSGEILVVDGAGEDVGYCFLAPVRVVGEAGAGGDAEVVEHEEGGEVAEFGRSGGWGWVLVVPLMVEFWVEEHVEEGFDG